MSGAASFQRAKRVVVGSAGLGGVAGEGSGEAEVG